MAAVDSCLTAQIPHNTQLSCSHVPADNSHLTANPSPPPPQQQHSLAACLIIVTGISGNIKLYSYIFMLAIEKHWRQLLNQKRFRHPSPLSQRKNSDESQLALLIGNIGQCFWCASFVLIYRKRVLLVINLILIFCIVRAENSCHWAKSPWQIT